MLGLILFGMICFSFVVNVRQVLAKRKEKKDKKITDTTYSSEL